MNLKKEREKYMKRRFFLKSKKKIGIEINKEK